MLGATTLSQHAFGQLETREVRHVIPACSKIDKLSQHAVVKSEARKSRHTIPACIWDQSQVGEARHTDMLSQHAM